MKILLAILCGLMVLFSGGCALLLVSGAGYNGMFQSLPGAIIPGGIAALNVLVLIALFGTSKPQRWAFYMLAALDMIPVLVLAGMVISYGITDGILAVIIGGIFAIKAILTFMFARRLA